MDRDARLRLRPYAAEGGIEVTRRLFLALCCASAVGIALATTLLERFGVLEGHWGDVFFAGCLFVLLAVFVPLRLRQLQQDRAVTASVTTDDDSDPPAPKNG